MSNTTIIPFPPRYDVTQEELADFEAHHAAMRMLISEVERRRKLFAKRLKSGEALVEPGELLYLRRKGVVIPRSEITEAEA